MVIKNIVGDMHPYAKKKIDSPDAQKAQRAQQTSQQASRASADTADRVVLSPEARLRGAALKGANDAPDVRSEKIRDLKERVRNGTYEPDIKKAAANLIRDDLDLLV
ncbi:flagellar biosynthesis anti-sigma factor FlgM [Pseudodesulfovibrio tunisiensis]|uniref:flagellar biosynthesis anti-sigma factor FlgM n=1 Tax=Pseudodesulfovibrio tunisiensis TaxID=463192 RepID=UPI001FB36AF2|nr:flagellar biosynthesis anti-sigma factor FlgM [Pseudodesulfovibrio tunisiensis]